MTQLPPSSPAPSRGADNEATVTPKQSWQEASQARLEQALEGIRVRLGGEAADASAVADAAEAVEGVANALDQLTIRFRLTAFERDLLLLAAGMELDGRFRELLGGPPTFASASVRLDGAHWSALAPDAALRRGHLIALGPPPPGGGLVERPIAIEESVLYELLGLPQLDERLRSLVDPLNPSAADTLLPSRWPMVERLVGLWTRESAGGVTPLVRIPAAGDLASVRAVVAAASRALGWGAFVLDPCRLLAFEPAELEASADRWRRDGVLHSFVLVLELEAEASPALDTAVRHWLARADGPVVLVADRVPGDGGGRGSEGGERPMVSLDLVDASVDEGSRYWRAMIDTALGSLAPLPTASEGEGEPLPVPVVDDADLERLARQFPLPPSVIEEVVVESVAAVSLMGVSLVGVSPAGVSPAHGLEGELWYRARRRARGGLDLLAQRLEPVAAWPDLILPAAQTAMLRSVASHVRHRGRVYDEWGFAGKSKRGLGLAALFSGPSGTGKTLAAEVLAKELRLDLYRIDLSALVSKYIGETERNLCRLFDAAEKSGAILLFDEADSLFGKRSEVKDSHDRYANLEVSYLLQRVESYRGLAILTTNFEKSVDSAFLRRLRFVVPFPFPAAAERKRIWSRVFPAETPTEGLDLDRLAQLAVTGGSIRNIAMAAAFRAAARGENRAAARGENRAGECGGEAAGGVTMADLQAAARAELVKIDRPIPEAELRGWAP